MSPQPETVQLLHHFFRASVTENPQGTAVEVPNVGSLSYVQLDAAAEALCKKLVLAGVQKGDVVGFFLKSGLLPYISILAILKVSRHHWSIILAS